jgi:hypothetical protein
MINLPADILRLIYEFDPSFHIIFKDDVLPELEYKLFQHSVILNNGYSIRNFPSLIGIREFRYYDIDDKTIKGNYIRGYWNSKDLGYRASLL